MSALSELTHAVTLSESRVGHPAVGTRTGASLAPASSFLPSIDASDRWQSAGTCRAAPSYILPLSQHNPSLSKAIEECFLEVVRAISKLAPGFDVGEPVQEAIVKLLGLTGKENCPPPHSVKAWLIKAATRRYVSHRRRAAIEKRMKADAPVESIADYHILLTDADEEELRSVLAVALGELSDDERQCVSLCTTHSKADASEIMRLKRHSFEKLFNGATAKLRAHLTRAGYGRD